MKKNITKKTNRIEKKGEEHEVEHSKKQPRRMTITGPCLCVFGLWVWVSAFLRGLIIELQWGPFKFKF